MGMTGGYQGVIAMRGPDPEYWNRYYENHHDMDASPFAVWCYHNYLYTFKDPPHRICDLGCGNGRDTNFFRNNGLTITPVDQSPTANVEGQIIADVSEVALEEYDAVYARWLFHAVTKEAADGMLRRWDSGAKKDSLFLIEARSWKDGKPLPNTHYRRPIDLDDILPLVKNAVIRHVSESRGYSKVGEDDPLLIRLVLRHK